MNDSDALFLLRLGKVLLHRLSYGSIVGDGSLLLRRAFPRDDSQSTLAASDKLSVLSNKIKSLHWLLEAEVCLISVLISNLLSLRSRSGLH